MTCEERLRIWEGQLEPGGREAASLGSGWDEHLDTCERCQAARSGFALLREAVEAWPEPPSPSRAALARLEGLGSKWASRSRSRSRCGAVARLALPVGLVASAFAIAWLGSPTARTPDRADRASIPVRVARSVPVSIQGSRDAKPAPPGATPAPGSLAGLDALVFAPPSPEDDRATSAVSPSPEGPRRVPQDRAHAGRSQIPASARRAFGFLLGPDGSPADEFGKGI